MAPLRLLLGLVLTAVASAACDTETTSADPALRTSTDSAEQVMYKGRMIIASNGVRRGVLSGDTVLTFDAATRFDLRPLTIEFQTALGRPLAVVTAPGGVYTVAPSMLETRGSVTILSDTTRRRMTATAVRYDPMANLLTSDSAFTATSGPRQLTGVGFTADPGLFSIKCLTRCTGSLGR